ncbi:hypothetical protein ES708_07236 [subsurface metagenome]
MIQESGENQGNPLSSPEFVLIDQFLDYAAVLKNGIVGIKIVFSLPAGSADMLFRDQHPAADATAPARYWYKPFQA